MVFTRYNPKTGDMVLGKLPPMPRPLDPDYLNPEQSKAAAQIESEWQAKQSQSKADIDAFAAGMAQAQAKKEEVESRLPVGTPVRDIYGKEQTVVGYKYGGTLVEVEDAQGRRQDFHNSKLFEREAPDMDEPTPSEMTRDELAAHPASAEHMGRALQASSPQMKAHHTRKAREAVEKSLQTGARGGKFYVSPTGQKVYVKPNPGVEITGTVEPTPFVSGLPQSVSMNQPSTGAGVQHSMMFGNRPR